MSKANDVNDERDKLKEQIERLETSDGNIAVPRLPSVKLEEKQYLPPSDAELEQSALGELQDYKTRGEQTLRERSKADADAMTAKRDAYIDGRDAELSALGERYETAVRATDADAVKRGLARSSVAAVNRGELESEYLRKNADVARTYGKKLSELDADIAAVDDKLRAALNDFNLSYAVKLNGRLSELKAECAQKVNDVAEYNNKIRAEQAKMDADRAKTESDLLSDALARERVAKSSDKLSSEARDKLYRAVYAQMDGFLGSMSPDAARIEIRNHSYYREHLSDYYYKRLYDKYGE